MAKHPPPKLPKDISVQFSSVLFHTYSVIQYKIKDNLLASYMYNRIYKITKKIIQFSKHYLVISYDQRYSKAYFNVIMRLHPPCNRVRQKSAGFVYLKGVSGTSKFQKLYKASNRFT